MTAHATTTVRVLKLLKFDLHDFILDRLDRRLDFDEIADSLSDQRSTHWRLDGDAVEFHIGFILPDERILALRLGLLAPNTIVSDTRPAISTTRASASFVSISAMRDSMNP